VTQSVLTDVRQGSDSQTDRPPFFSLYHALVYEPMPWDCDELEDVKIQGLQESISNLIQLWTLQVLTELKTRHFWMIFSEKMIFKLWNDKKNAHLSSMRERWFLNLFESSELQSFSIQLPIIDQIVEQREETRAQKLLSQLEKSGLQLHSERSLSSLVFAAASTAIRRKLITVLPILFAATAGFMALTVSYKFMSSLLQ
jgi:hypothetical protein